MGKIYTLKRMDNSDTYSFNDTHFNINFDDKRYSIGYKKIAGEPTDRSYDHLSRYGDQVPRRFSIRSGKYALGNNPNKIEDLSTIAKVHILDSEKLKIFIIKWRR